MSNSNVGNEFRAVGKDALKLGTRCLQAGRAWLTERKQEMNNCNDENRPENLSTYGRSGEAGRQNQQAQNQPWRDQSHGQATTGQYDQGRQQHQHSQAQQQQYGPLYQAGQPSGGGHANQQQDQSWMQGSHTSRGQSGLGESMGYSAQHPDQSTGIEANQSAWSHGRGTGSSYGQGQQTYADGQGGSGRDATSGQGNQGRDFIGYGQGPDYPSRGQGNQSDLGSQGQQGYPRQAYSTQNQYSPGSGLTGSMQSHRGRGPKNYSRSDERISDDINERLTHDHDIDASEIEVKVQQGAVTLEGTVEQRWMKHRAEDLADGCSGVKQVENKLRVAAASSQHPGGQTGADMSTAGLKSTQQTSPAQPQRNASPPGKDGSSSAPASTGTQQH